MNSFPPAEHIASFVHWILPAGPWVCIGPNAEQSARSLARALPDGQSTPTDFLPAFPPDNRATVGFFNSTETDSITTRPGFQQLVNKVAPRGLLVWTDQRTLVSDDELDWLAQHGLAILTATSTPDGRHLVAQKNPAPLRCAVCDQRLLRFAENDGPFALLSCPGCRSQRLAPILTNEELTPFYQGGYRSRPAGGRFPGPLEALIRWFRGERVRALRRNLGPNPKRLLDVGCGRGAMLRQLKALDWDVEGTELNAESCQALQSDHIPAHQGTLEDFPDREPFDVITLFHVLEHCPNLDVVFQRIQSLSKPNAALVIEIPNGASTLHRLAGPRFLARDLPFHQHQINPSALADRLATLGWQVDAFHQWSLEHGPFNFSQTLANFVPTGYPNAIFRALQARPLPPRLALAATLQAPVFALAAAAYPLWFLLTRLKRGSENARLWLTRI